MAPIPLSMVLAPHQLLWDRPARASGIGTAIAKSKGWDRRFGDPSLMQPATRIVPTSSFTIPTLSWKSWFLLPNHHVRYLLCTCHISLLEPFQPRQRRWSGQKQVSGPSDPCHDDVVTSSSTWLFPFKVRLTFVDPPSSCFEYSILKF